MVQTFRDTQFRNSPQANSPHDQGDPYPWGRVERMTSWERALNLLGRLFGRSLTRVGGLAQRVAIMVEVTHLRLRLRTLYSRLGKLVFWLRVGEERRDTLEDRRIQSLLRSLRETHRDLASQRERLESIRMEHRGDEFAGA